MTVTAENIKTVFSGNSQQDKTFERAVQNFLHEEFGISFEAMGSGSAADGVIGGQTAAVIADLLAQQNITDIDTSTPETFFRAFAWETKQAEFGIIRPLEQTRETVTITPDQTTEWANAVDDAGLLKRDWIEANLPGANDAEIASLQSEFNGEYITYEKVTNTYDTVSQWADARLAVLEEVVNPTQEQILTQVQEIWKLNPWLQDTAYLQSQIDFKGNRVDLSEYMAEYSITNPLEAIEHYQNNSAAGAAPEAYTTLYTRSGEVAVQFDSNFNIRTQTENLTVFPAALNIDPNMPLILAKGGSERQFDNIAESVARASFTREEYNKDLQTDSGYTMPATTTERNIPPAAMAAPLQRPEETVDVYSAVAPLGYLRATQAREDVLRNNEAVGRSWGNIKTPDFAAQAQGRDVGVLEDEKDPERKYESAYIIRGSEIVPNSGGAALHPTENPGIHRMHLKLGDDVLASTDRTGQPVGHTPSATFAGAREGILDPNNRTMLPYNEEPTDRIMINNDLSSGLHFMYRKEVESVRPWQIAFRDAYEHKVDLLNDYDPTDTDLAAADARLENAYLGYAAATAQVVRFRAGMAEEPEIAAFGRPIEGYTRAFEQASKRAEEAGLDVASYAIEYNGERVQISNQLMRNGELLNAINTYDLPQKLGVNTATAVAGQSLVNDKGEAITVESLDQGLKAGILSFENLGEWEQRVVDTYFYGEDTSLQDYYGQKYQSDREETREQVQALLDAGPMIFAEIDATAPYNQTEIQLMRNGAPEYTFERYEEMGTSAARAIYSNPAAYAALFDTFDEPMHNDYVRAVAPNLDPLLVGRLGTGYGELERIMDEINDAAKYAVEKGDPQRLMAALEFTKEHRPWLLDNIEVGEFRGGVRQLWNDGILDGHVILNVVKQTGARLTGDSINTFMVSDARQALADQRNYAQQNPDYVEFERERSLRALDIEGRTERFEIATLSMLAQGSDGAIDRVRNALPEGEREAFNQALLVVRDQTQRDIDPMRRSVEHVMDNVDRTIALNAGDYYNGAVTETPNLVRDQNGNLVTRDIVEISADGVQTRTTAYIESGKNSVVLGMTELTRPRDTASRSYSIAVDDNTQQAEAILDYLSARGGILADGTIRYVNNGSVFQINGLDDMKSLLRSEASNDLNFVLYDLDGKVTGDVPFAQLQAEINQLATLSQSITQAGVLADQGNIGGGIQTGLTDAELQAYANLTRRFANQSPEEVRASIQTLLAENRPQNQQEAYGQLLNLATASPELFGIVVGDAMQTDRNYLSAELSGWDHTTWDTLREIFSRHGVRPNDSSLNSLENALNDIANDGNYTRYQQFLSQAENNASHRQALTGLALAVSQDQNLDAFLAARDTLVTDADPAMLAVIQDTVTSETGVNAEYEASLIAGIQSWDIPEGPKDALIIYLAIPDSSDPKQTPKLPEPKDCVISCGPPPPPPPTPPAPPPPPGPSPT